MLIEAAPWLVDILEEHQEELLWLWPQWQAALRSDDYVPAELADLEERIEAHTDALVLADEAAVPLLEPALAGEPAEALAAAYALLRMADPERAAPVLDALGGGEGETLWALARGIGYAPAPAPAVSDALRRLVGSREAPGPAAAA